MRLFTLVGIDAVVKVLIFWSIWFDFGMRTGTLVDCELCHLLALT